MAQATDKRFPYVKVVIGLLIVAGLIALFHFLPVKQWLEQFKAYVQTLGAAGYVLYVFVYMVCCVLFVPAIALTIGAGAIYGVVTGSIIVIAGATLGSTAAFLLARTVLRHRVEGMTAKNAKFRALDKAISQQGAKIVFLVRLAPVFPFTWVNYAFGLTGIRLVPYMIATLVGIIPGTVAFVWASAAAAQATSGGSTTKLVMNIVGAVMTLVASVFVGRIATQAIRRAGVDGDEASRRVGE